MAHMIDLSNGDAAMAFVGETPWHGLGQQLAKDADFDTWRVQAGMDWECVSAALQYDVVGPVGVTQATVMDKKALYRSDNFNHLAVVGNDFKVVQPTEVLEFFRDLTAQQGFKLETAGCLFGGRRFWALARTGAECRLRGIDKVEGYLLLATACDGTLATTAQFTNVRVVCQNTLTMSLAAGGKNAVKTKHRTTFKPDEVKYDLGLDVFAQFEVDAERLIELPFDRRDKVALKAFLVDVFEGDATKELDEQPNKRAMIATFDALCNSPGADLPTARNTGWGALNAVTRYVDFERPARGQQANDNRFATAQWGLGAQMKQRALDHLLKLAA